MSFASMPHAWTDRIPCPVIQIGSGKVQYANAAAQALFHSQHCEKALEALRNRERLAPLFFSAMEQGESAALYAEVENNYFLLTVWPGDTPDIYFLLFDSLTFPQTEQVQKEHTVMSFMSALGNELRAPLSIVFPTLDLLAASLPGNDEKVQDYLSSLRHYSFKMLRRMRNLTDLPLLLQGQVSLLIKPHDIVPFLQQIVDGVQPYVPVEKVTLEFSSEMDSLLIFFDAEKLGRALLNLFAFSLKRLSEGGKIRFSLRDCDTHVFISLQDTGLPLHEQDMIMALDFYQHIHHTADDLTNRQIGLELCIVRAIAELHNGSLLLTGSARQGFAATIALPKQKPDTPLVLKSPAVDSWSGFMPQLVELSDAVPTGIAPYTCVKKEPKAQE